MNKKSLYRSIFGLTCPRCRKGKLFVYPGLFRFRSILKMPKTCPVCDQTYEIEPGFWIGALWASYPIIILIEVPFLLAALFAKTNPWGYFGLMLVAFLIFYPLMLRLGRSIWIHLFVRFDSNR